jgi:hypothetical protein
MKPHQNFCSGLLFLSLVDFLYWTYHSQLSEQFSESLAAFGTKPHQNFSSGLPSLSLVDILYWTYNHRRLSKQLLESQAAIWKPQQASWRRFLEGFKQLLRDIIEARLNFIYKIFPQKGSNILWKPSPLRLKFIDLSVK